MAILRGIKALQRLCERIEGAVAEVVLISDKFKPSIIRQAPCLACKDEEIVHASWKHEGSMSRRLHRLKKAGCFTGPAFFNFVRRQVQTGWIFHGRVAAKSIRGCADYGTSRTNLLD
jgi:hypothetical protein